MPLTVKQLQEQRAPIGAEIRKMADTLNPETKPDFNAEERSKWEKANDDFSKLTRQIEIARQAEELGIGSSSNPSSTSHDTRRAS